MNDYLKGTLTGASLVLCFFMFISAKSQSKNLGDIIVNSIRVLDAESKLIAYLGAVEGGGLLGTYNAEGKPTVALGTGESGVGFLQTFNADDKETAYFGTDEGGGGILTTSNTDGKMTVSLGTNEDGLGQLRTYNKHEVMTGIFGTNTQNDGMAILSDRYGDIGWIASGKK